MKEIDIKQMDLEQSLNYYGIDIKQILKENYELNKFRDAVTELSKDMFDRYRTLPTASWGDIYGPHRKTTVEYGGLYAAIIENLVRDKPRFADTVYEVNGRKVEANPRQETLDSKELLERWEQAEANLQTRKEQNEINNK
jgi:hypothetical protein